MFTKTPLKTSHVLLRLYLLYEFVYLHSIYMRSVDQLIGQPSHRLCFTALLYTVRICKHAHAIHMLFVVHIGEVRWSFK